MHVIDQVPREISIFVYFFSSSFCQIMVADSTSILFMERFEFGVIICKKAKILGTNMVGAKGVSLNGNQQVKHGLGGRNDRLC